MGCQHQLQTPMYSICHLTLLWLQATHVYKFEGTGQVPLWCSSVCFSLTACPGNRTAQAPPCWWKVHGNHQSASVAFSNQQQICPHWPQRLRVRGYYCIDVQTRSPGFKKTPPVGTSREHLSYVCRENKRTGNARVWEKPPPAWLHSATAASTRKRCWAGLENSAQEDPSSEACVSVEGERHTEGATGQLVMQPSARFLLVEYLQDWNCHSLPLNSLK